MLRFEQTPDEAVAPTLVDDRPAPLDDVETAPTEPITVPESPTGAAARVLEVAAVTADRLVSDAETEAESLVTTARATADEILAASRTEARQVAADLAEEKAALEAQIATLLQMQSDHRSRLRQYLTEQLSLLDTKVPEPPAVVAG